MLKNHLSRAARNKRLRDPILMLKHSKNISKSNITTGNINNSKGVAIGPGSKVIVNESLTNDEITSIVENLIKQVKPKVWDGNIPYQGLIAFQESDAKYFFGRENLVGELLNSIQQTSFITIAGPSGSGKSSVARAGLFHALREGKLEKSNTWRLAIMQPKDDPIEQLAFAIGQIERNPNAGNYLRKNWGDDPLSLNILVNTLLDNDPRQRFVLLVDQFEELFTQTKDDRKRAGFIRLITAASLEKTTKVKIVLSLRSDFISHCTRYPVLRELMNQQIKLVGAMDPSDLVKAITKPSLKVGTEIDPALVAEIVEEMKGEPGALPLMSFALRDLFLAEKTEKDKPMDLTLQEYLDHGGIQHALEKHANKAFNKFSLEQKDLAEIIFSKLIEVGEGRPDTRRTVEFKELIPVGTKLEDVLKVVSALSNEEVRLLTTDSPILKKKIDADFETNFTVTIAHEKLIEAWPWLRQLVDNNREIIALQNQVKSDALTWIKESDEGYLYRGAKLLRIEEILNWDSLSENVSLTTSLNLDEISLKFIEASRAEEENQLEKKRIQLRELQLQTELAKARALATQAEVAIKRNDPKNAFLFALKALNHFNVDGKPVTEADVALTKALIELPYRSILKGHTGSVNSAFFNHDGSKIVTASSDKTIIIWNNKSESQGEIEFILKGHEKNINSAIFNHDGSLIVSTSDDKTARLWHIDGSIMAILEGHTEAVNSAVFNNDSSKIITASSDGTARLWNGQGKYEKTLSKHTSPVKSAIFSQNGNLILTSSEDEITCLWNREGTFIALLKGSTDGINQNAFSINGEFIVTSSRENKIAWIWDKSGAFVDVLKGHTDEVTSAAFNHGNPFNLVDSRIITSSTDGTARLWKEDGTFIAALREHTDEVYLAKFNYDGNRIITTSWDNTTRLWDDDGHLIAILEGHTKKINSAEFDFSGSKFITASADQTIWLWDGNCTLLSIFIGHRASVTSATFNHDSSRIITASADKLARLWGSDGTFITTLQGHSDRITSAKFNHDGSRIITASEDHNALLWDMNGELADEGLLIGHEATVNYAEFNPTGTQIITASDDHTARLWNKNGKLEKILKKHTGQVNLAIFNPAGSQILTAGADNSAHLWEADGTWIKELKGHMNNVSSVSFNHRGSQIITTSWDHTARLWNAQGNLQYILEGHHTDKINYAMFSQRGNRIITASNDKTVCLWDNQGKFLNSLVGHTGMVWKASFNHDGSRIVTASSDRMVRLWDGEGNFISLLKGHTDEVFSASFNHNGSRIITNSRDGTARLWESFTSVTTMKTEAIQRLKPLLSQTEIDNSLKPILSKEEIKKLL